MYDVITVGSNYLDIFAHTDKSQLIGIRTQDKTVEYISYPVGAKILVTRLLHNFGGNGANTGVAFSRMGLKTGYVGKVGKDTTGSQILASLKKNKVAFLGVLGGESGTSIILDAMEEDRTILTFKGCNNDLKVKELGFSRLKAKWFYLSSMLGDSLTTMRSIAEHAKEGGMKISFNPSQTIVDHEKEAALALLKQSNLVVLNKEEAESLVGAGTIEDNLQKIVSTGPEVAVITDGKNGAVAYRAGEFYTVKARTDLKIVETTGAGDAFASTFTAGIILKKPVEQCLLLAINQAESVIQNHGAQNNLLDKKALLSIVSKDRRLLEKRSTR
ncbi:carbohydrate kinase family protein [Candidatus Woesearchaeota archaeon]|nr:carbohydrate kinase family protein [Candidatus Woesearchaeota archaeon]